MLQPITFNDVEPQEEQRAAAFDKTGFPSPSRDYLEAPIDLNKVLVKNPTATFFARVRGNTFSEAGIDDGDLLVIDRSLPLANGRLVLCCNSDSFELRRVRTLHRRQRLVSPLDNETTANEDVHVWGVVRHLVKKMY